MGKLTDTDYFFLCPTCHNMTIATGSSDLTDFFSCQDCRESFKARLIAGVGKGILIKGRSTRGNIGHVYQADADSDNDILE